MVGQLADLVSAEMAARVEDFDFVLEAVVEMAMKVEDSDFEVVVAILLLIVWGMIILIGWRVLIILSKSPISILYPFFPRLRLILRLRLRPRLLPRIPVWWGLKIHWIVKSLILWPLPRSSCNKTKRFYRIWDYFLLKDSLKTWD